MYYLFWEMDNTHFPTFRCTDLVSELENRTFQRILMQVLYLKNPYTLVKPVLNFYDK